MVTEDSDSLTSTFFGMGGLGKLNSQKIVKTILSREGWTQKRFSEETGIDKTLVSRILKGKRKMPPTMLQKMRRKFPYIDYRGQIGNPPWVNEIHKLLVENANKLTTKQIKEIEQSVKYNLDQARREKDNTFHIYKDWGFFASDLLNALENLLSGLIRFDHIYCERLEDPWDENSRYHSGLVGKKPFGRRTIKSMRDWTGENFMADTMLWNKGKNVQWYTNNEDYLPWQDSVMAIPIVTREGRGIIISIHSYYTDFNQNDLEIAQNYIHLYLESRQVPIMQGEELAKFIKRKGSWKNSD